MGVIFESEFHKHYMGEEGEVAERPLTVLGPRQRIVPTSEADILDAYRRYIGDNEAVLPKEIRNTLLASNRTENDRE